MKSQHLENIIKKALNLNHTLHIQLGLFLILLIWIFFFSGLMIHHGEWGISKFYEKRIESKTDFTVPVASLNNNPDLVEHVKKQLGIVGEVQNYKVRNGSIDFRVISPGYVQDIHIDSATGNAIMKALKYNFWGKLRTLHLFNGIDKNNPSVTPNWIAAKLWRIMMDITAVILIILCLGSWIMWYKVRRNYKLGYVFLGAGLVISVYYMFVVDML